MSKKQKTGGNQALVEQQNQKLNGYVQELTQLQTDIESNQLLSVKHGRLTLELAVKAGGILREAKKLVAHGQWEKWLTDNVKGITVRTAQNYMRLAKQGSIKGPVSEPTDPLAKTETQHVAFLGDAETLRKAYLVTGIIKKTPEKKDGGEVGPKTLKRKDPNRYNQIVAQELDGMSTYVRAAIEAETSVNWKLSEWSICDNKLTCGGKSSGWVELLDGLMVWVSTCDIPQLTHEDAIYNKTNVVLLEVLKTVFLANCPSTLETKELDDVPNYSFEVNREPVEVSDRMAA